MELTGQKITIIGGGVGGLTAALALQQQGAVVTVLEQADAISEVGAGLQITPNGVAVLAALGLRDDIAWCSQRGRAVVLRHYRKGRQVVRLDLDEYAADQQFYFVHRSDLISILADAVRQAGVQVRLLQKVERVDPGSSPVVHLANGDQCHSDLIVGADGLHSKTRKAFNNPGQPFFTGQVAWRATVPNAMNLPPEAQVFMGPKKHLVAYPLRDGNLVNIVAVQERSAWADEGWNFKDDPANLRAAFRGFGGTAAGLLAAVEEVNLWGLFRHPVAIQWYKDRVAILGDAAHPTLPFMAQGANMALEDAWALCASLLGAKDIDSGLQSYQEQRYERTMRVVAAANGNAWKYHLRQPLAWPAHQILKLAGRFAPQKMVSQYDWIYRHDVTAKPS